MNESDIRSHHASIQKSLAGSSLSPGEQADVRLRVQIPSRYRQEPIITRLVLQTAVEVNILGGILTPNTTESGWFDLQLRGTRLQLECALDYLANLGVIIWDSSLATVAALTSDTKIVVG